MEVEATGEVEAAADWQRQRWRQQQFGGSNRLQQIGSSRGGGSRGLEASIDCRQQQIGGVVGSRCATGASQVCDSFA